MSINKHRTEEEEQRGREKYVYRGIPGFPWLPFHTGDKLNFLPLLKIPSTSSLFGGVGSNPTAATKK